ncbi:MAG: [acyl-carrier-protein] S-malonyltransferase [Clostridiales bacterium]|nr:[acyl-carrier-protein] S-malonyltransferase [Clostridiales bacterium]
MNMSMVFLFSGQGSQYPGMGKDLIESFPHLSRIFNTASDILGFNLKEKCFEGSAEELSKTIIAQPAIMATSIAAFEAAIIKGLSPVAVAGHSLGEYAAMVASEILTLEDGFVVIKARAEAMQRAAEENPGAMCAVLGRTESEVEEICSKIDDYVVPVNYNSPAQTVIAGTVKGIEKAEEEFAKIGAKTVRLNVSAAFHSKLMQSAADEFYEKIKDIKFHKPNVKFYSNVLGDELTDFSDMPSLLAKHMVSPVRFTSELQKLSESGASAFIECGPGKVLTGLVKKTLKGAEAFNIEDCASLEKCAALAKK